MYSELIFHGKTGDANSNHTIGVLKGEGIGPEVIDAALYCLDAVGKISGVEFPLVYGGDIGKASELKHGEALSHEVREFCSDVFAQGGVILAGAGGSRFVYDLRKQYGLYCKLSPLRPFSQLRESGCLKPGHLNEVDIMIVRENISGVYQGEWNRIESSGELRATHAFQYKENEVRDILLVAAGVAKQRKNRLSVIYKESGLPSISNLWKSCAEEIGEEFKLDWEMVDVDYAAYRLIKDARDIDVIVAPNLFGDILSDLGALLLGSRGMSYSGNFSKTSAAVYQTNHGAGYDLAGTDRANPIGQILSLSMLLRESMGLIPEADLVELAIQEVLGQGFRTFDIFEDGCQVVGTRELGERIAHQILTMKDHVKDEFTGIIANRSSA
jgi:3-isopropylmalate dehydrogenase